MPPWGRSLGGPGREELARRMSLPRGSPTDLPETPPRRAGNGRFLPGAAGTCCRLGKQQVPMARHRYLLQVPVARHRYLRQPAARHEGTAGCRASSRMNHRGTETQRRRKRETSICAPSLSSLVLCVSVPLWFVLRDGRYASSRAKSPNPRYRPAPTASGPRTACGSRTRTCDSLPRSFSEFDGEPGESRLGPVRYRGAGPPRC
jgi:hypothetical protein